METLRILVVDDEEGMRMGVSRALRSFTIQLPEVFEEEIGFTVDQAETGEEALEKIRTSPPDILLLDHKLPGISGLDVLRQVSEDKHDLLTVMITAYATLETAIKATKTGAYDFLAKPFTPQELKGAARKAARHLMLQRQARKLAEEKRQIRFQFISVLAHEMKAPIGAVEGYLNILKEGYLDGDLEARRKVVERSISRLQGMKKMILDLLDLTRIESGQKKREIAQVSVREIAERAVETMAPQADERGIAMRLDADGPVPMAADQGEIEIVLNNLVSNAVKYNRDGGEVSIRIGRENGAVKLEVRDTGIGMNEEEAARLFGDFVRIRNAKTQSIMGSGLGLSTVRKIARLYGGDATVSSRPDEGSTFVVTLNDASPGDAEATEEPNE